MTPTELATEAAIAANKVGQDRVSTATITARGKRLYRRKRLAIHQRFPGIFYRTEATFTLTTAVNTYTPSPAMLVPILVEVKLGTGSTALYQPVKLADRSAPDSYFGWMQQLSGSSQIIRFTQAGQAAGDYRLTYVEDHAPADGAEMVLPPAYEDVLVAELAAWLRSCYEEDAEWQRREAKELEAECDDYLRGWNGMHPRPGLTNG